LALEFFGEETGTMRIRGRYRNQTVELAAPLTLADGTEVEVDIILPEAEATDEKEAWQELGMSRLEVEWDNPEDAIYDNWRELYDHQGG
jgi:hypothetical protein